MSQFSRSGHARRKTTKICQCMPGLPILTDCIRLLIPPRAGQAVCCWMLGLENDEKCWYCTVMKCRLYILLLRFLELEHHLPNLAGRSLNKVFFNHVCWSPVDPKACSIKPVGPSSPVPWTTECTGVIFLVSWRYGLKMETPQYPRRDGLMISEVSTSVEKRSAWYININIIKVDEQLTQTFFLVSNADCISKSVWTRLRKSLHHPVRASW